MNHDFQFSSRRSCVLATRGMVATSQPLAAQAGLRVLQEGGNAADAAVAAAAMLCVVEPVSNGLGGDMFALYFDAKSRRVHALNGSGRAPKAASIAELKARGHAAMPRFSGAAVTVPGAVRGWESLLTRFGSVPLARLLSPATETAEKGFGVSEWIGASWALGVDKLLRRPGFAPGEPEGPEQPSGRELLLNGRAPRPGELMKLHELARVLRGIALAGADYIYTGLFARKLSEHVRKYGGWITPEDMSLHESTWETPLATNYRGVTLYECPPNGQGLAAILACNLARGFELGQMDEASRVHCMIECMRLAFADAQRFVCDPAFAEIPLRELCAEDYASRRRALISEQAAVKVEAGDPLGGSDTVYLSVIDGEGNACSFIQSNYMGMGTGLVVPGTGVSLQNRGALFSLDETHPNALQGGKRPYHTIIPALTTREGELHACFGIMGGHMQPQAHFQVLSAMVDLGLNPQQALDRPRWQLAASEPGLGAQEPGGRVLVEEGMALDTLEALRKCGHQLRELKGFERIHFGGGQVILRENGLLVGGSDSRKDGCAAGW